MNPPFRFPDFFTSAINQNSLGKEFFEFGKGMWGGNLYEVLGCNVSISLVALLRNSVHPLMFL